MPRPHAFWILLCLFAGSIELLAAEPAAVSFERDVMAVLSKAGCNAGTCHGNFNGKGGFYLSLRGQDPQFDYEQLVHAAGGRRLDAIAPAHSLTLAKATAAVAHEGGKRFSDSSIEYQLLIDWIKSGARPPQENAANVTGLIVTPENAVLFDPTRTQQLQVTAIFSDESQRDVTSLAVYEPSDPTVQVTHDGLVQFERPCSVAINVRYLSQQFSIPLACRHLPTDFVWSHPIANNFIDDYVFGRLRELKINPAARTNDSTFIRRLSLDLLGVLPSADEARQFVADSSPQKRTQLVDRYLAQPEFAAMWAQKWSDLLRNEEKTLDAKGVEKLHAWIQEQFADDVPLNHFAAQLISARGSTYDNPPANYWRALREPFIRSETTAQVFLGVRLQCAKCHNHPFDRWSQDEYYQWSSLFEGIDYEIVANERKDDLDKHEFVGDQVVKVKAEGLVKNARTGDDAQPKFLGSDDAIAGDRLEQLAAWMTHPTNRMFAKTQVNRIWYHLMGVGQVDPIDDLRATNPAAHPQLLERLTDEFINSGFSVKHLVRLIVSSSTYQLDSEIDESQFGDDEFVDPRLMTRAVVRRLTAEQILDAQSQVIGVPAQFEGYPVGTRAVEIAGVERVRRKLSDDDRFLRQFGKPTRLLACECERSNDATLGQALSLVGGSSLNARLRQSDNRLGQLLDQSLAPAQIIDEFYWAALARSPSADELAALLTAIDSSDQKPRELLEDVVWALLNSKEMLFRN